MKRALVTGGLGNLGTSVALRLLGEGYHVTCVDNNSRKADLGAEGDVYPNLLSLTLSSKVCKESENLDIVGADISTMDWEDEFPDGVDVIVHCAAQVSHPRSIEIPVRDFTVNVLGTLRLLEFARHFPPESFVHIGTAKIYGENVDRLCPYREEETRYWYTAYGYHGVDETCSFDQTMKTPFGCSKASADLYVQEYGSLYGLRTSVLRPGVFTGKYAKPVIYQNWVGELMKQIISQDHVDIIGWKGKQVRDVLHTEDLVDAIMLMIAKPPVKGEVYNIGGGMGNAISVIEAFTKICEMTGRNPKPTLGFKPNREGDWCVYVTDNSKLMKEYPEWKVKRNLEYIFKETLEMLSVSTYESQSQSQHEPERAPAS